MESPNGKKHNAFDTAFNAFKTKFDESNGIKNKPSVVQEHEEVFEYIENDAPIIEQAITKTDIIKNPKGIIPEIIEEEIEPEAIEDKITLYKEDAELVAKLIRAKRVAEASGIDISVVLQEMTSKKTEDATSQRKRQINFKRNSKGDIIGAEVVNEK